MRCKTPNCLNECSKNRRRCGKCRKRQWREKYPYKYAYDNLKSNAKRRNIPVNITLDEFVEWGIKHSYFALKGTESHSFSIDRKEVIDLSGNVLGYTVDNMQVLTLSDNSKKQFTDKNKEMERKKYCPREPGDPF